MRKILFFAVVSLLGFVQFDGFADTATRGSARNVNNIVADENSPKGTTVSARAATRSAVKNTNSGVVSARAAATQKVVNNVQSPSVSARAAAKQKVINTGTKVAGATENTLVPQECQDAFYGCMDAFCMLDNASGGRCQCNDRINELDDALDEILKLDEQTYIMATEGVERIEMGEAEEEIMARAKSAADKAVNANKEKENKKTKTRNLDLSLWNNTVFSENDDLFDSLDMDSVDGITEKKGSALYKASAKMCAAQVPTQCRSYDSMLQLVYAQKIKSDCLAYENSLKAQKSQSQQKLQAAQQALREAALDEYQKQNRYKTTGECAIALDQCMKTEAGCGDDYTGCVTLAAAENVRTDESKKVAKQTTIKGVVKGADITLAASTVEQLLAKKLMCESVTKQCVNSNKNDEVWTLFLRNAAPALKSAELVAEQNLRSNCLPSIVDCFKKACKSNFGDGDSYDACLTNPTTYKSLCKVELEPCLEATGGTLANPEKSTLWESVVAMLNAGKVDACTNQIKTCLTDRCGSDYSECIGLSSLTIINICPTDVLTACRTATDGKNYTGEALEEYVAQIAQGLMIQMDNSLLAACQNAANEAMIRVCGDTESCDITMGTNGVTDTLSYQICEAGNANNCKSDVSMISNQEYSDGKYVPDITGKIDWGNIVYGSSITASPVTVSSVTGGKPLVINGKQVSVANINNTSTITVTKTLSLSNDDVFGCGGSCDSDTNKVISALNNSVKTIMSSIDSDPKVTYCRTGREVPGLDSGQLVSGTIGDKKQNFPNLTNEMRSVVAGAVYSAAIANYKEKLAQLQEKADSDMKILAKGYSEEDLDAENAELCAAKGETANFKQAPGHRNTYAKVASYDKYTNICTVMKAYYSCRNYHKNGKHHGCSMEPNDCEEAPGSWCLDYTEYEPAIQMPKSSD